MAKKCPPNCTCGKHRRRTNDGEALWALLGMVLMLAVGILMGLWRLLVITFDPTESPLKRTLSGLTLGAVGIFAAILVFVDFTPLYLQWTWGKQGPFMVARGQVRKNYMDEETRLLKVIVAFKGDGGRTLSTYAAHLARNKMRQGEYSFALKIPFDPRIRNAGLKVFDQSGQEVGFTVKEL